MSVRARTRAVLAALAIAAGSVSCEPTTGRGELLRCEIGDSQVWLSDDGSFDLTLQLHVRRAGRTRSQFVIDKSTYGTLRMIKYQGRVLIANGDFLFCAYDPESDQIIAYHDLPFTIREGQGEVVDRYTWSGSTPTMRSDFPKRRESAVTSEHRWVDRAE